MAWPSSPSQGPGSEGVEKQKDSEDWGCPLPFLPHHPLQKQSSTSEKPTRLWVLPLSTHICNLRLSATEKPYTDVRKTKETRVCAPEKRDAGLPQTEEMCLFGHASTMELFRGGFTQRAAEEKLLLAKRDRCGQHGLTLVAFGGSSKRKALRFRLFFQQKGFVNNLKPDKGAAKSLGPVSCQQATRESILLCIFTQGK